MLEMLKKYCCIDAKIGAENVVWQGEKEQQQPQPVFLCVIEKCDTCSQSASQQHPRRFLAACVRVSEQAQVRAGLDAFIHEGVDVLLCSDTSPNLFFIHEMNFAQCILGVHILAFLIGF